RELLLQRCRDRRGHRLRTGARQPGRHRDRREVHVREIAHRQEAIRHQPEHENAEHDERRRHRTANEESRDAHRTGSDPPPALVSVVGPPRISTLAFGVRRSCPSVTTSAPAGTPAITVRLSSVRSTVTGWVAAVPSLFTTNT